MKGIIRAGLILTIAAGACSDKDPSGPEPATASVPEGLGISNAVPVSTSSIGAPGLVRAAANSVAYVSAAPGTFPEGTSATVRNTTAGGATRSVELANGGFDPVGIDAADGDELSLTVMSSGNRSTELKVKVPPRRPPAVVRTSPSRGRTDVALNVQITVVFTEPISVSSATTSTVALIDGANAVAGSVRLSADGLTAEFTPDNQLRPQTTYILSVRQGIFDLDGDPLAEGFTAGFTTTTIASPLSLWESVASGTTSPLYGVWGNSASDVWAVGGNRTIVHYNSLAWSSVSIDSRFNITDDPYKIRSVWGASAADVFAVGSSGRPEFWGTVFQFQNSIWNDGFIPPDDEFDYGFNDVWGSSASDVWAVGDNGGIYHYNGTWARISKRYLFGEARNLNGVWGSSASNVWAVGDQGTVSHYDGSNWATAGSGTSSNLNAVWGISPVNVWAVGNGGTIMHFNGAGWSPVSSGTLQSLHAVWGTSAADVWAVGDNGIILHYDGLSWSSEPSGTTEVLHGVWGSLASEIWAVGEKGTILHRSR